MPPDANSGDQANGTKPCKACQELIKPKAKVCIHCGGSQGWTRNLFRWSAILAAAAAIIPLWSAALSLRELLPRRADLRVFPISCNVNEINLAVSNLGGQPGVLGEGEFLLFIGGENKPFNFKLSSEDKQEIIIPGDAVILSLKPSIAGVSSKLPAYPSKIEECFYQIIVSTYDFKGNTSKISVSCPCPES